MAAEHPLTGEVADLSRAESVQSVVRNADLVIGAVPGFMGFATLQAIIEAGKDVVDISFFGEDPFALDALAKARGVTAVVDCGVAPGLSNMVLGYHAPRMTVESFRCLVGGLPAVRTLPWQYKAPFSPIDVLEEYTRPARLVAHSAIVTRPALSEPELVEFEQIGTLEAFNTDGLRSLLVTMSEIPNMVEKTLRYPGHIDLVRALRESGFLSHEPITAGGSQVRPIDVTAALLFQQWRLGRGEPEFTAMEINVRGQEGGTPAGIRIPSPGSHRRAHRHVVDGTHHGLHLHGRGSPGAGRPVHPGRHLPARVRGRGRDLLRARAGRSGGARCAGRAGRALNLSCLAVD